MNSSLRTLPSIFSSALLGVILCHGAMAQQPPQAEPPGAGPGNGPGFPGGHGPRPRIEALQDVLSPDEMRQFGEALRQAKDDERLSQLRGEMEERHEAMRSAFRDALLKVDPSLQPILDKLQAARKERRPGGERGHLFRGRHGQENGVRGLKRDLTDDQRTKLDAAREKAAQDPAVIAAREKLKNAGNREQKSGAARELQDAMRDAMLRADPSLEPLLEKSGNSGAQPPAGTPPPVPAPADSSQVST